MPDFTIKANDTRPAIEITLQRQGVAAGLASTAATPFIASLVKLLGKSQTVPAHTFVGTMSIASAAGGLVRYTWLAADTQYGAEVFDMECEVTWSDGGKETFPEDTYLTLDVKADLG